MLDIVKGHHLQLRFYPLLLHNFRWVNFKAATVYHPIIQKEVDKLLAKGAINPFTGDAGIYSGLFLSALVVYDPYSVFSNLITIPTYLLLTCLHYQTGMATYSMR